MSEIRIDNNTRLDMALKCADEGECERALFFLRNNEDYESCLNRVVLLFKSFEFVCARELIFQYAARFADKYTYCEDLQYAIGKGLTEFGDEQLFAGHIPYDRKTCDRTRLLTVYDDEDFSFGDLPDEDIAQPSTASHERPQIFDTKSYDYYYWLFNRAEEYNVKRKYSDELKIAEKMAQYDGDDAEILEMILITLLRTDKFDQRCLEIALKLDQSDTSDDGKIAVSEVFSDHSQYRERALELVGQLYQNRSDIAWAVLVECLRISNDKLKDKTLAVNFAQYICEQEDSATFFLIKKCIHVFCNFGEYSLADKAAKFVLSQCPGERFCLSVVNFCSHHKKNSNTKVFSKLPNYAHNVLPQKVVNSMVRRLNTSNKAEERIECNRELLDNLEGYLWHLKGIYFVDNTAYVNGIRLCLSILQKLALLKKDIAYFAAFAKRYLCSGDTDVLVRAILLKWIYNIDTEGTVMVQTLLHPYFFELQLLKACEEDNDKLITVCFLAGVLPLNARKVSNALKQFETVMKLKGEQNKSMAVSQMAYCILRRMYPNASLAKYFPAFDDIDYEYWDKFALSDKLTEQNTVDNQEG